jgi:ribosomal protein L32
VVEIMGSRWWGDMRGEMNDRPRQEFGERKKALARGGKVSHVEKCPKCSENTYENGKCKSCGYEKGK